MLRKLLVFLFIVTSLSAQVSTAFACEMTGEVVLEHCCCDGDGEALPAMPVDDPCCEQITGVTADDGASVDLGRTATTKAALDLDAWPLPATLAGVLLPDLQDAPRPATLAGLAGGSGTLTYLQTLRLRI